MALSTSARTKRDGSVAVSDSGAANTLTQACEPGDFTYTPGGYATERYMDRTEHKTPRKGDAQVTTLGWSAIVTTMYSTTEATMPDVCEYWNRTNSYVNDNWTSTLDGSSDVFSVDVTYGIDGTYVGEADVTILFNDVSLTGSFSEGAPSTYSITGEASIIGPVVS